MRLLFTLIVLICTNNAMAWSDWSQERKNWYLASNVAILADWATTRDLSRRYSEGYYEINPVLGKTPSTDRVDQYFVGALILHYFVTDWLSPDSSLIWLKGVTLIEGSLVAHNLGIGLRIRF